MIIYILMLCLGISAGALTVWFVVRPKLRSRVELDGQTAQLNEKIAKENEALKNERNNLQAEYLKLNAQRNELENSVNSLKKQADDAAEAFYAQSMELAQTNFEIAVDKMSQDVQEWELSAKEEYLQTLKEVADNFNSEYQEKLTQLNELNVRLTAIQATVEACVAERKRAAEIESKTDFYRLVIPEADIAEIKILREVLPRLRDSEPLNKVIWKIYYEKPYSDLVGRVVGSGVHTGIYKITNLENGMCYVGQAVNIADRWRQHIKRGLGAEALTRNKLYPAMLSFGVENFSFEVIEECDKASLNDKEDYWQDFYKAKEFGYSIK